MPRTRRGATTRTLWDVRTGQKRSYRNSDDYEAAWESGKYSRTKGGSAYVAPVRTGSASGSTRWYETAGLTALNKKLRQITGAKKVEDKIKQWTGAAPFSETLDAISTWGNAFRGGGGGGGRRDRDTRAGDVDAEDVGGGVGDPEDIAADENIDPETGLAMSQQAIFRRNRLRGMQGVAGTRKTGGKGIQSAALSLAKNTLLGSQ